MEKKEIETLMSEVDLQVGEIDKIYAAIEERKGCRNQLEVESLCLWLHNLYGAFEGLLEIIAKAFENNVMGEDRYHIELLRRMTADIKGIRPAFLSEGNYKLLDNLRSFRHKLRHMYIFEIDVERLKFVIKDALGLKQDYKGDINRFFRRLKGSKKGSKHYS